MRRKQDTSDWEDIGDILTPEAFEQFDKGDLLRFNKDGQIVEWKIMRKNKRKRKCWVKPVRTYTVEELEEMAKTSKS